MLRVYTQTVKNEEKQIVEGYSRKGLSEMQIANLLSINPHRVRHVLDRHNIRRRTHSEAITNWYITKFGKRPFVLRKNLSRELQRLKSAGVMLYWGGGTKRGTSVTLANSDPKMILVFVRFLREVCQVDEKRIRIGLHHYRDHDVEKLRTFWSRLTKIPTTQFDKPFLHLGGNANGSYRTKSEYGTVLLRYSDMKLLNLLISWIEEYQKDLLKKQWYVMYL